VSLNPPAPSPRRRFVRSALLFGLLQYAVLLLLAGLIFLLNHIPPKAVSLDPLILVLFRVEQVLTAPRRILLWLCPGESTPRGLPFALAVFNSVVWGVALAGAKALWRRLTV
jgi:hypothetical protein